RTYHARLVASYDAFCCGCRPSANSSIIFRLKAGISEGLRLVIRPLSTFTSLSTQLPPAFFTSVFKDGHDVRVRPRTTSASTRVHGPWHIAATGLLLAKKLFAKATAFGSIRRWSG